jgi:proline iminopeptidase
MVFSRLVTHYWSHDSFLVDGQVIAGMTQLAAIPSLLVHGRYDVSSPLATAWQLHRAWPASRLVIVDDAGHGGGSFISEVVAAVNAFRPAARRPRNGGARSR